jgi:hypothetical protein
MDAAKLFDAIFLINLPHRTDRWTESMEELAIAKIPQRLVTRWEPCYDPKNCMAAGARTHRLLMRHVAGLDLQRVLILEDDFCAITKKILVDAGFKPEQDVWKTHCSVLDGNGTFVQRFAALQPWLPLKWDVLYLAGGYGEPPLSRFNKHVLRVGRMKCTSTFMTNSAFARKWTAWIDDLTGGDLGFGLGACDDVLAIKSHDFDYYCLQPRLLFQRASYSETNKETISYLFSMTDPVHEMMV